MSTLLECNVSNILDKQKIQDLIILVRFLAQNTRPCHWNSLGLSLSSNLAYQKTRVNYTSHNLEYSYVSLT